MSNILRMDTSQVSSLASQIEHTGAEIDSQVHLLQASVSAMDWQSYGRDQFVSDFDQLAGVLADLVREGAEMAARLRRETEEWETAAASLAGGAAVTIPPVVPGQGQGDTCPVPGIKGGGGGGGGGGAGDLPSNPAGARPVITAFNVFKASLSTLKIFSKSLALDAVSVVTGGVDFFGVKMPRAEQAFQRWEDYNRQIDNWDPVVAHQYEAEAREALKDLGLGGLKDPLDKVVEKLPHYERIEFDWDVLGALNDWLEVGKK